MERLRSAWRAPTHGQEHVDIERRLDEQEVAVARLDAYVSARQGRRTHPPRRRAGDA